MWFDNPSSGKRQSSRNGSRRQRKPMFVVNARLKDRQSKWAPKAGGIALAIFVFVVAVLLCWAGVRSINAAMFTKNPDYLLTNLIVKCESPVLRASIIERVQKASAAAGTNLFQIPIASIRTGLWSTVSIKNVTVSRRLPHTLEVSVVERIPIARLGSARDLQRCLVVDDDGVVFPKDRSLPLIIGYPDISVKPGDNMKKSIQDPLTLLSFCGISPIGQVLRIAAVEIRKDYLDVKLQDGPRVSLAWNMDVPVDLQYRELEERMKALLNVMRKAELAGVTLQTVDLTHDKFNEYCPTTPRWDRRD